jgi:hypothetical protein
VSLFAKDFCEDIKDEYEFFDEICERVIRNPRFYLNELENGKSLQSYRFSFINYKKKKGL